MLKSYAALIKDTKKKAEGPSKGDDAIGQSNSYMMLPNQKYIKIVVGSQNQNSLQNGQNSFQNVFLNVVPAPTATTPEKIKKTCKDTNQNVFLNINNTIQKFIPIAPLAEKSLGNLTLSQLLNDSKSEELSVEIDPTDFQVGEGYISGDDDMDGGEEDWDDVILPPQRKNGKKLPKSSTPKNNGPNYVPILPKQTDEKLEFFNSGQHFLSSSSSHTAEFYCEMCQKTFPSYNLLRNHFRDSHLGKYPHKCDDCNTEFTLKSEYDLHINLCSTKEFDNEYKSLTLNDFNASSVKTVKKSEQHAGSAAEPCFEDLRCNICKRQFSSASGLLRHKVRKHNQKAKKKYFIKGMKNARCDICKREFSTQSYMQLHRKLHLRDDIGYKYKVFSKDRYIKPKEERMSIEQKSDNQEAENESYEAANILEDEIKVEEIEVTIKQENIDESNSECGDN